MPNEIITQHLLLLKNLLTKKFNDSLFTEKVFKTVGRIIDPALTSKTVFPYLGFGQNDRDFEMLIIGDSIISGQGLNEENQFSTLTKNWLEDEMFSGQRTVNLINKSHSGSRIYLAEDEIKALEEAGRELDKFYHPEINLSFPSMKTQVDVALDEYKANDKPAENIDLIMLTGGLTNLNASDIINPFNKNSELREKTDEFCNHKMFEFLQYTGKTFPNALIMVIGYPMIVSKKSSSGKVYNAILELYEFPRPTKPVMNNLLTKQFFKILHNFVSKRCMIWFKDSNKAFQTAVDRHNKTVGQQKAVFVESPIDENNCFGTKRSLVWEMAKNGRTNDQRFDERVEVCNKRIESMKDVKLKFRTRFCELAGVGHPNIEGSKAYAESIKKVLLESSGSFINSVDK